MKEFTKYKKTKILCKKFQKVSKYINFVIFCKYFWNILNFFSKYFRKILFRNILKYFRHFENTLIYLNFVWVRFIKLIIKKTENLIRLFINSFYKLKWYAFNTLRKFEYFQIFFEILKMFQTICDTWLLDTLLLNILIY